jgi:hypothetical protein
MRKLILLSPLFLITYFNIFAQQTYPHKDSLTLGKKIDLSKTIDIPTVYINATKKHEAFYYYTFENQKDVALMTSALFLLDQNYIKQMDIVRKNKGGQKFGDLAKSDIILLTFKSGADLINKKQLFNKYNIMEADQHLPIYVDDVEVTLLDQTIFMSTEIAAVKISKIKK